jgi:hypothetical protein
VTDAQRIDGFWKWWARHSGRVADAIESGNASALGADISRQVDALHPGLQWELTPGFQAQHGLCVTAAGAPELRPLAERWVRAAPPADETWEYHPARIPDPRVLGGEFELGFGPNTLDLSESRVSIVLDDERQVVDLEVYHPQFEEMDEDSRAQVTYLVLDWTLGEDGVERWVGRVDYVAQAPNDALRLDALVETVEGLAERSKEVAWVLFEWERDDGAVGIATARRPLKWIDYPLFDQHIAISVYYSERNAAGLPERSALDRLRAAEDELLAEAGDTAVLAAHETIDGVRTFHFYADSQDPTAEAWVKAWAHRSSADPAVEISTDPGWSDVRPYA